MEDKGNNPVGSGGPRSFGKVPLSAYLRCLDADELGQALAKIRDCDAWWAVKCCLIFMALTCVRSNEARGLHLGRGRLGQSRVDDSRHSDEERRSTPSPFCPPRLWRS